MSDKDLSYVPQPLSDTINDITDRHNQISFPNDTPLSINRVDTASSETKYDKFKVFGTDLKVKSPYRMGNLYTFLFLNNEPIFTIGPQCIIH
mgnify:CR=1 FL=1